MAQTLLTGLNIDQFHKWLRNSCGSLTEAQMPDEDANELLQMAQWDIEHNFDFKEKESTWDHVFIAADQTGPITIPFFLEAFQSLALLDLEGNRYDVIRESRDSYETAISGNPDHQGVPERYHRYGDKLYLRPFPSSEELGWTVKASLTMPLTSFIDSLPRNWNRILIMKATALYHSFHNEWALANAADAFANSAIRYQVLTQAKEERDSDWAGVQVPDRYPVGGGFTPGTNGFNEF